MGTFLTPGGKPLVENSSKQGIVWLNTGAGSKIVFKFVEARGTGGADGRAITPSDPTKIKVSDVVTGPAHIYFSLTAYGSGVFTVTGLNAAGSPAGSLVVVAGSFENHAGMETDLLAKICRGGDAGKIAEVQRLLFNDPKNIFDQKNDANMARHGGMGCGKVCKASGESLFGGINPISYENPYHEPLKAVKKREDVKYRSSTIDTVRSVTAQFLKNGVPVRVGVLDSPIGMHVTDGKLYAYFVGGHSVLIVGCNRSADKFLYIDPWVGGSKLKYSGAFSDAGLGECSYLGTFKAIFDRSRVVETPRTSPNLLRQTPDSEGTFNTAAGTYMEIVSGPPVPRIR